MCGLVVVRSPHPVAPERVPAALARLGHRGPDGRGSWSSPDGTTVLGHVRLAIVDLAHGAQPIENEDGTLVGVVHGELYDADRLRESLRTRGHTFRTGSDSEVAIHLYEELGEEAVHLFRGEFALVLWDERRRRLFAARDRFGIKPLFYTFRNGELLLASEVKALFAAGHPAAWDEEGMFQSLHLCLAADHTLYRDVRQVPPGNTLVFEAGRLRVAPYWAPDYPSRYPPRRAPSEAEAEHEVGRLLEDAVRQRLRADVPLACYLSGGVDSSAVLGLASRFASRPPAAFTVSFDHAAYDESAVAARMAARAGAELCVVRVTPNDYADVFVEGVALAETAPYNGHAPARYLLSRAVQRAGYKVALGGEGADEVFLGYEFIESALRGGGAPWSMARLGAAFRPRSAPLLALGALSPLLARLVGLVGFPPHLLAYLGTQATRLRGLLAPDFVARHRGRDPFREALSRLPWGRLALAAPAHGLLHAWLSTHFTTYILAAERLDMAHAVELRLPFLDHALFDYVKRLPVSLLHAGGENKHLLRRVAAPFVTDEVRLGAKKPFFAPPTSFVKGSPLHTLANDLLRSAAFQRIPFFDGRAVLRQLAELEAAPEGARAGLDALYFFLSGLAVLSDRYALD